MRRTRSLIFLALVLGFVIVVGVVVKAGTQRGGAQDLAFDVTVTGGRSMQPSDLDAHQGDHLTIKVTSDQEGEVHLHGYDIVFEVRPGESVDRSFTADRTCTCAIEWEETSTPLGTLTVRP